MKIAPALSLSSNGPLLRPMRLKLRIPLTDADMLWLSANNEGIRFEQSASGLLILTPPTGGRGNRGESILVAQLVAWNERTKFGEILGISGGVLLPNGGQYAPDAAPISRRAWDAIPMERRDDGFVPVLPTATFELLSPANLTSSGYTNEFIDKLSDYKRSAIPLIVLLNPRTQSTVICRPERADEITRAKILTVTELPGFELNAGAIYAAVNAP